MHFYGVCDVMSGLQCPHHRIKVSGSMRENMCLWLQFLKGYNGVSLRRSVQLVEADLQVCLDAAGGYGLGSYFRGHWCDAPWPELWVYNGVTVDMTFLELFPLVVAVPIWGDWFLNSTVRFWCDN